MKRNEANKVDSESQASYNKELNTLIISVSGVPRTISEVEENLSKWITAINDAKKIANSKIWLILDIRDLKIPSFRTVPKDIDLREVLSTSVQSLIGVIASNSQRIKMRLMFLFLQINGATVEYVTDAEKVIEKEQEKFGVFPPL